MSASQSFDTKWFGARVATCDDAGNVYVATPVELEDDEGEAVWSFARDGRTRFWTLLELGSPSGMVVTADGLHVVTADGCVVLDLRDGRVLQRSEEGREVRIVRCPNHTLLVISATRVVRMVSLSSDAGALPIFGRQKVEQGFLSSLFGGKSEPATSVRGVAATWLQSDLLVHDDEQEALVRYTDEGDVALRVKAPFGDADEMQTVGDDAYILARGDLWRLRGDKLEKLPIAGDIDAFAADPGTGIWVFRSRSRELVPFV